ncbi:MAG TPA: F0F1 ATP synthase subunit gamma [Hyphomicrobiales bacterium]|nr:F0F1 ATP synthase subunit gamma [Hyphomicrobiales bacterium]
MASLKELRNRIASVKSTQKITKAMQMVAAAKLRRAQEAALAARPYSERMRAVLANLAHGLQGRTDAPPLMAGTGRDDTHLLVVCTADRGLSGGFNASIAKIARDHARRLISEGKTVKIICVGKKGYDILRRLFSKQIIDLVELRSVRQVGFANAHAVADKVLRLFEDGEFDVATLFFAEFRSVISQRPTALQLIPTPVPDAEDQADLGGAIYDYEPGESEFLEELLPRNVAVQIFRALLENAASEQGARMSAMDNATRNAGDMIDRLSMNYNRTRQAMITKELIEIISGAEAL